MILQDVACFIKLVVGAAFIGTGTGDVGVNADTADGRPGSITYRRAQFSRWRQFARSSSVSNNAGLRKMPPPILISPSVRGIRLPGKASIRSAVDENSMLACLTCRDARPNTRWRTERRRRPAPNDFTMPRCRVTRRKWRSSARAAFRRCSSDLLCRMFRAYWRMIVRHAACNASINADSHSAFVQLFASWLHICRSWVCTSSVGLPAASAARHFRLRSGDSFHGGVQALSPAGRNGIDTGLIAPDG